MLRQRAVEARLAQPCAAPGDYAGRGLAYGGRFSAFQVHPSLAQLRELFLPPRWRCSPPWRSHAPRRLGRLPDFVDGARHSLGMLLRLPLPGPVCPGRVEGNLRGPDRVLQVLRCRGGESSLRCSTARLSSRRPNVSRSAFSPVGVRTVSSRSGPPMSKQAGEGNGQATRSRGRSYLWKRGNSSPRRRHLLAADSDLRRTAGAYKTRTSDRESAGSAVPYPDLRTVVFAGR
jgi:hypothetical protein